MADGATDLRPVQLDAPGRGRVYDSFVETIGNTPLVRVPRLSAEAGLRADLMLKLEFFNPLGSVKDRIGLSMILELERSGAIAPGATIIEPTSGNTGIGLAFVGAARGYKVILTMPDSMSIERRKMLVFLGARLELTPREQGIKGAIARAEELQREIPGSVIPSQFDNPANPAIHEATTAEEIWRDTDGGVDAIVFGIGTGGTFTGCARALKPRKPALKFIAVEPELSQVLAGGEHQPHPIMGIGAGFVPGNMDVSFADEIIPVSGADSVATARRLAVMEGVPVGISSGAALWAGLEVAKRPDMAGKKVVVIIPSFAERYLSTVLFEGL